MIIEMKFSKALKELRERTEIELNSILETSVEDDSLSVVFKDTQELYAMIRYFMIGNEWTHSIDVARGTLQEALSAYSESLHGNAGYIQCYAPRAK
ncbi:hypothetical protein EN12_22660 [Vibrio cholerae]|uniref:Uncharacterized protein n=1 Tax=Vibrio cholerae TaxID=666 RepID=A0A5B1BXE2_VIBCL|nr:hypothetical protein [Vibrio cholerae]AKO77905.1 hypothetical protein EN12_22660 [Vibrio cholerae]KAA1253427.1 hypothetical protein F0M16_18000 [Vibrio cholerae]HDV5594375.1 hypothetical protein [Vibrio cholerae]